MLIGQDKATLSSLNIRWWRKQIGFVGQAVAGPGAGPVGVGGAQINGRSSGSNLWRYVNVAYFGPYVLGIFPEN